MKTKLYTYSETRATFPFALDERENALYLVRGERGIPFTIPIPLQGEKTEGREEVIISKKIFSITKPTIFIFNILVGAIDLKIIQNVNLERSKVITNLKKIRQDTQIILSLTAEGVYSIEVTPLVKTRIYLIKQLF